VCTSPGTHGLQSELRGLLQGVEGRFLGAARMTLPRRPLCSGGPEVSIIGFGASPLGSVFASVDEDLGVASVHEAVRLGVNFFDVSPYAVHDMPLVDHHQGPDALRSPRVCPAATMVTPVRRRCSDAR
jgi:hypothetical protein